MGSQCNNKIIFLLLLRTFFIIYKKTTICKKKLQKDLFPFLSIIYRRNTQIKKQGSWDPCFSKGYYSVIVATTPAPTVRPPSRIENLVPSSIAIGAISSTVISMLSPGITISTPSGS